MFSGSFQAVVRDSNIIIDEFETVGSSRQNLGIESNCYSAASQFILQRYKFYKSCYPVGRRGFVSMQVHCLHKFIIEMVVVSVGEEQTSIFRPS